LGLRENEDLDEVAHAYCRDQQQDYSLDGAHPEPLQGQKK